MNSAEEAGMKKKIYCFNNGGQPGMLIAAALCEDGHFLAEHCCSSENYMRHDLGMEGTWKHDYYDAHCGVGRWELEWVSAPKSHAGVLAAYDLHLQRVQDAKQEVAKQVTA